MDKKTVLGALGFILGAFIIYIGLSFMGVFTSAVTAPSRVITKTLQTDNIIQNYEWFFDVHAGFISKEAQVRQYSEMYSTESDASEKRKLRIEMTAIQNVCRSLVTKYNANSEKMNTSVFKGWDLPSKLNINNCEV